MADTQVLIIGSGIAGLSCAITLAQKNIKSILVSPFPSERAQSVLAAGGINAVMNTQEDSIESHIDDTIKGGCFIAGKDSVKGLCEDAPEVVKWLESLGTVFSLDEDGSISKRAFGGQSHKRTRYCGASTGKQIVTALVMKARHYEGLGLIERRFWNDFHSALIKDNKCYGVVIYNEATRGLETITADYVVIATGGQNALFGKTTGSTLCDGYAAGKLFTQGVDLKNLEFIQYHPTTIETDQKHMLVSEAARGEGGRLYYEENGKRVYFMEELYGENGNLMPRDIVSKCIYETGKQVYLDVTHLGEKKIRNRIPEVNDLCLKYAGVDITKDPLPIVPSIHFFMGGIAVKNNHETNIENLYAIGECASMYHGANRLGGNSLLAALHGGRVAGGDIAKKNEAGVNSENIDWTDYLNDQNEKLKSLHGENSQFPVMYIRDMIAESMKKSLGIVRNKDDIEKGIDDISYYLSIIDKIHYDNSELTYYAYSLPGLLELAKAVLLCASFREESRGAHSRKDYPVTKDDYKAATIISYNGGDYKIRLDKEGQYES